MNNTRKRPASVLDLATAWRDNPALPLPKRPKVELSPVLVANGINWYDITQKQHDAKYYDYVMTSDPFGRPNPGNKKTNTKWRCRTCGQVFQASSGSQNISRHQESVHEVLNGASSHFLTILLVMANCKGSSVGKAPGDDERQLKFIGMLLEHWKKHDCTISSLTSKTIRNIFSFLDPTLCSPNRAQFNRIMFAEYCRLLDKVWSA